MTTLIANTLWDARTLCGFVTYMVDELRKHTTDYQSDIAYDVSMLYETSEHTWDTSPFIWVLRPMGTHLYHVNDQYSRDSLLYVGPNYPDAAYYVIDKKEGRYRLRKITKDEAMRMCSDADEAES